MAIQPQPAATRPRLARPQRGFTASPDRYSDLKAKVHRKLLNSLNTDTLRLIGKDRLRVEIGSAVEQLLLAENKIGRAHV